MSQSFMELINSGFNDRKQYFMHSFKQEMFTGILVPTNKHKKKLISSLVADYLIQEEELSHKTQLNQTL